MSEPANLGSLLPNVPVAGSPVPLRRPGVPPQVMPYGAPDYNQQSPDTRSSTIRKIGYRSFNIFKRVALDPLDPVVIPISGKAVLFQGLVADPRSGFFVNGFSGENGRNIWDISFDNNGDENAIQFDTMGMMIESVTSPGTYTESGSIPERFFNGFAFGKITIKPWIAARSAIRVVIWEEPLGYVWGGNPLSMYTPFGGVGPGGGGSPGPGPGGGPTADAGNTNPAGGIAMGNITVTNR